jgi:hypothetical protein
MQERYLKLPLLKIILIPMASPFKKGIDEKEPPQSVDGYREMLRKYLMIHNGRLLKEFDKLYKLLHIAGYYRGLLEDVTVVKDALKAARLFIDKIK